MNKKSKAIDKIRKVIAENFGDNIFQEQATEEIDSILFRKELEDGNVTFSIITNKLSKKLYSIQVISKGSKYRQFIGNTNKEILYMDIDIPLDKNVTIEELIEIFESYK